MDALRLSSIKELFFVINVKSNIENVDNAKAEELLYLVKLDIQLR